MNVCTDSPNSLSVQVVFTSRIPNSSGNHRVLPAPHQRGNSSQFPSLLLAGIMKTPYTYNFVYLLILYIVYLFFWNPIEPSHPHSIHPPPSHSTASKTSSSGWDISPPGLMGWHSQNLVGMLPANRTPAQVHIACLQGIFKAFVLPFQGSHSKRMILWIVVSNL